jgi:hypothetical protein
MDIDTAQSPRWNTALYQRTVSKYSSGSHDDRCLKGVVDNVWQYNLFPLTSALEGGGRSTLRPDYYTPPRKATGTL